MGWKTSDGTVPHVHKPFSLIGAADVRGHALGDVENYLAPVGDPIQRRGVLTVGQVPRELVGNLPNLVPQTQKIVDSRPVVGPVACRREEIKQYFRPVRRRSVERHTADKGAGVGRSETAIENGLAMSRSRPR